MTSISVEALRSHGIRATAQRVAVLRAVSERPHVSADVVLEMVQLDIGAVSRQAVYDALNVLVENGLIRRIQPVGSPARYEDRVNDNHHHLICRLCGDVVDVDCVVGAAPCLEASDNVGFDIDEAEIAFWGRCAQCQSENRTSTLLDPRTNRRDQKSKSAVRTS
jgi:Fe2+ or Zn2+ uptake regulation protein